MPTLPKKAKHFCEYHVQWEKVDRFKEWVTKSRRDLNATRFVKYVARILALLTVALVIF